MASAKIDPELLRQLDTEDDRPVQAIVQLRIQHSSLHAAPEQTEATAHQVVDRVQKLVGEQECTLNIFRNLGTFMIAAQPRFLRELMSQPEVASVAANRQPESAKIEPVRKRPASIEDVREAPVSARRRTRTARRARPSRRKP